MSKNTKGFTSMSDKEVSSALALVSKAQGSIGPVVALSAKARRALLKPKRGAQQVIPMIATLAAKYGLEMSSMPIADMVSKEANAEQLRVVLGAVVVFQKLLKDAILSSEGEAWQTATAMYSALRRAAKTRPTLAAELVPVETWFRHAHRGTKAASATPTTAPSTSASPVTTTAFTNGAGSKANGISASIAPSA